MPRQDSIRNRLLALVPTQEFALLRPHLEALDMPLRQILFDAHLPIEYAYFPETGIVSVIVKIEGHAQIEVGIYGREGMGGTALLMGADRTPHYHMVQVAGSGYRVSKKALIEAVDASRMLHTFLLRFVQVFTLQTTMTAVVNGTHMIGERLARWLLMCQDRMEKNEFPITHAFLATMLGVRRPGVTDALIDMEGEQLIKAGRGKIRILDRAGLLVRAGASYGIPEAEYLRLIGSPT